MALISDKSPTPAARPPVRVPTRYDNRITLQKLEVFCSVVDLGGVSKAADHLWVAQSVVSGHLKSLQDRLGVQVLYRDGQRMRLTKAGEQVYRWASETLAQTRQLMRQLEDLNETGDGTLASASSLAAGSYLMPPVLAAFRHERPGTVITMSVSDPEAAFSAVASGECDMGIVVDNVVHDHPHLRCEEIGREEITLVVAADGLAGRDGLTLADVSRLAVVAPPTGHLARVAVDRLLEDHGFTPQNVVMELGHPEAMKRVIRTGDTACLLFRSCVEDELATGTLREIPLLNAELSLPVVSVARADVRPSSIQIDLIEHTRAYLAARHRMRASMAGISAGCKS